MKYVAIDAGPNRFMVAEGKKSDSLVRLSKVFTVDIPTGSVADGIISDMASVRSALEASLKFNRVRSRSIAITVNSNSAITRKIEVPFAREKDMHALVDMEMRQFLPTGRLYVVDYVTIGEAVSPHGGKMMSVKAVALPSELCEGYYRLLLDLNRKPFKLDAHQQVLGRIFAVNAKVNGKELGRKAVIAIEMSYFQTNLHVVINGEVDLSRTLPVGSANMERMVADRIQSTPEDAKIILRNEVDIKTGTTDAADAVRRFLMQLILEVRKIHQYVRAKNLSEATQVYLYGSGSGLKGMDEYMKENIELETETVASHSQIIMPTDGNAAPLAHYLNAAGVLLKA